MKLWKNTKGIILEQKKEPALSRDLQQFISSRPFSEEAEPLAQGEDPTLDRLIRLCEEAHIIDERDGRPLDKKLSKWKEQSLQILVGDAIDEEPYVSSQINPMLKNSEEAAAGLRLLHEAMKPQETYFAVYREMYDLNSRIPQKIGEFPVKKVGGRYPMEQRAIRKMGKNALIIGVGALIHLCRAAYKGIPQTTCFVTVAGNCIGNPCNLEVTIGTPVARLLDRCGLIQDPTYLMENGAMHGVFISDPENTLIRPNTSAVLAFREEKRTQRPTACMSCSRCIDVCPEGLNPLELYRASLNNRQKTVLALGIENCIGCSSCSYICPSKLELSYTIISMQQKLKKGKESRDED